jgi:pimeloyl-ACP methyl ester carboxylesterase
MVEASLRDVYGDASRVTPALVDRYFETTLREGNRRALVQRFQAQTVDLRSVPANVNRLRALTMPTLLVWGARDRLIPPVLGERFKSDIAGSRLVVLDGLGHVPQEEDAAASVAPVKAFLSGGS